jgi:D-inositol-3-phosphate glycosyltransferase
VQKSIRSLSESVCKIIPPLSRDLLSAYVSASDCIIIPSLSEGFGFSAREACNANKIVVASNAGSLPEVISGRHIYVEAGSDLALVEGCMKAYKGEVANAPTKNFKWEKAVRSYLELYKEILS